MQHKLSWNDYLQVFEETLPIDFHILDNLLQTFLNNTLNPTGCLIRNLDSNEPVVWPEDWRIDDYTGLMTSYRLSFPILFDGDCKNHPPKYTAAGHKYFDIWRSSIELLKIDDEHTLAIINSNTNALREQIRSHFPDLQLDEWTSVYNTNHKWPARYFQEFIEWINQHNVFTANQRSKNDRHIDNQAGAAALSAQFGRAAEFMDQRNPNIESQLPPITDPTLERIWKILEKEPEISDSELGQRVGLSRETANRRRNTLGNMGRKVRKEV